MSGAVEEVFKQCRSLGHEWKHATGAELHGDRVVKRSTCADCGMVREKSISRLGYLMGTRYYPPDGYARHGEERLANHEWRSMYVASLFGPPKKNGAKRRTRKKVA